MERPRITEENPRQRIDKIIIQNRIRWTINRPVTRTFQREQDSIDYWLCSSDNSKSGAREYATESNIPGSNLVILGDSGKNLLPAVATGNV